MPRVRPEIHTKAYKNDKHKTSKPQGPKLKLGQHKGYAVQPVGKTETEIRAKALERVHECIITEARKVARKAAKSPAKKAAPKAKKIEDKNPPIDSFFKKAFPNRRKQKTLEMLQSFIKNKVNVKPEGNPVVRIQRPFPRGFVNESNAQTIRSVISEYFYGGSFPNGHNQRYMHKAFHKGPKHDVFKGTARAENHTARQLAKDARYHERQARAHDLHRKASARVKGLAQRVMQSAGV